MAVSPYTKLTDKDKLGIVSSHIKNKEYALYNDELDILVESSVTTPDLEAIALVETRNTNNAAKLAVLKLEAKKLEDAIALAATTD